MIYLWFALGLIIIIKASDIFLDGVIYISRALKMPELMVGATIVSICTVLPETVISVSAALRNDCGLAFGNAAGSIICNTALILPCGIILSPPKFRFTKGLKRNSIILIAILAFLIFTIVKSHHISRTVGIGLIILNVLIMYFNTKMSKEKSFVVMQRKKLIYKFFIVALTAIAIGISSHILVENGQKIAVAMGVPSMIVGLVLTAIGSSLPELVTCIAAIRKDAAEISFGNILGANILNAAFVIGASSIVRPIYIDYLSSIFYLSIALCFSFYFFMCFMRKSKKIYRIDGIVMLLCYAVFILAGFTYFSAR